MALASIWQATASNLLLCALLVFACSPEAPANEYLAVRNGRLFDATDGEIIAAGTVLLRGDRVIAAGPSSSVSLPAGTGVIDAGGGFIMPGVIDAHVHLGKPLEKGQDVLTPWLHAGVTTLANLSSRWPEGLRRLAALSTRTAPRLYVASPILTAPGGYPAVGAPSLNSLVIHDSREGEAAVEHLSELHHIDLVKVAIERGFLSEYDQPGWPTLEPKSVRAITDAAHRRGKLVHAHLTQPSELLMAIENGCDVAAHTPIGEIPVEILQRAVASGFILTSTANIWNEEEHLVAVHKNLRRYVEMGGRVALGTDAPAYQEGGTMPLGELRQLEAAGLARNDILLAATSYAAAALGAEAELGTLEPGKFADLIVIEGDPLVDIEDLANVRCVVAKGEIVTGCSSGRQ